eukprot:TRINITY_DN4702_c0_g1_i2.p1 TRINITY_DN4702_c0_g1~~TRINITY_DN4702_c0_g1_i2.p1  ORF type:complete len:322 (+),score=68.23 TRINITY_DN4702_c0_g1_i2:56-1021(+)
MTSDAEKTRVVIDTDCGVDDAVALFLALFSPNIEVVGITCVNGNTTLDNVVANVRTLLAAWGKSHIPVFSGADSPLVEPKQNASEYHGKDGLGDMRHAIVKQFGEGAPIKSTHAAFALSELCANGQETTIIALGPMTNVALAIRLDGTLCQRAHLVTMGGATTGRGNCTPAAEFNYCADPEAAHMCFNEKFLSKTIVPWEVCLDCPIPWVDWENLMNNAEKQSPNTEVLKTINAQLEATLKPNCPSGNLMPDVYAVAVVVNKNLITHSTQSDIFIELQGKCRGASIVDSRFFAKPSDPSTAVYKMDALLMTKALEKAVSQF